MSFDTRCKWHKSCGSDLCHGEGVCADFEKCNELQEQKRGAHQMPRPYKYHISFFSWDKNGNTEIGEIYTNVRERLNTQNNIQKWQKEFIKEKDKKNIVIININRLKR